MRSIVDKVSFGVARLTTISPFIYELADWVVDDDPINVPLAVGSLVVGSLVAGLDFSREKQIATRVEQDRLRLLNPDLIIQ